MTIFGYIAGALAMLFALVVVSRKSAAAALVSLILLLLSLAMLFFALGAPFVAVIEIIIYAGAIMVLFVFLVMMLNLGRGLEEEEARLMREQSVFVPVALIALLFGLGYYGIATVPGLYPPTRAVLPQEVGFVFYTDYLLAVELASTLLLVALIAAFHLAPPTRGGGPPEGRDEVPRTHAEEASHVSRG